jgi:hypothetical protein
LMYRANCPTKTQKPPRRNLGQSISNPNKSANATKLCFFSYFCCF